MTIMTMSILMMTMIMILVIIIQFFFINVSSLQPNGSLEKQRNIRTNTSN